MGEPVTAASESVNTKPARHALTRALHELEEIWEQPFNRFSNDGLLYKVSRSGPKQMSPCRTSDNPKRSKTKYALHPMTMPSGVKLMSPLRFAYTCIQPIATADPGICEANSYQREICLKVTSNDTSLTLPSDCIGFKVTHATQSLRYGAVGSNTPGKAPPVVCLQVTCCVTPSVSVSSAGNTLAVGQGKAVAVPSISAKDVSETITDAAIHQSHSITEGS